MSMKLQLEVFNKVDGTDRFLINWCVIHVLVTYLGKESNFLLNSDRVSKSFVKLQRVLEGTYSI